MAARHPKGEGAGSETDSRRDTGPPRRRATHATPAGGARHRHDARARQRRPKHRVKGIINTDWGLAPRTRTLLFVHLRTQKRQHQRDMHRRGRQSWGRRCPRIVGQPCLTAAASCRYFSDSFTNHSIDPILLRATRTRSALATHLFGLCVCMPNTLAYRRLLAASAFAGITDVVCALLAASGSHFPPAVGLYLDLVPHDCAHFPPPPVELPLCGEQAIRPYWHGPNRSGRAIVQLGACVSPVARMHCAVCTSASSFLSFSGCVSPHP